MNKELIAAGLAWLRKVNAGETSAMDLPSGEVLDALLKWAERRSVADRQRDGSIALEESIAVVLKRPLAKSAGNGEILKTVTFRTPSWLELKTMRQNVKNLGTDSASVAIMDKAMVLLNTCDLEQPDFDRLSAIDAQRCAEALGPFLVLEDR